MKNRFYRNILVPITAMFVVSCDLSGPPEVEVPPELSVFLPPKDSVLIFHVHDIIGCHASEVWVTSEMRPVTKFDVYFLGYCLESLGDLTIAEFGDLAEKEGAVFDGILMAYQNKWALEVSREEIWSVGEAALLKDSEEEWSWVPPKLEADEWDTSSLRCRFGSTVNQGVACGYPVGKYSCKHVLECEAVSESGNYILKRTNRFDAVVGLVEWNEELFNSRGELLNREKYTLSSLKVGSK